jgi:3-hydroxybutyrate dehydrogenase
MNERVAIVTGAASGIGQAVAERLAAEHYRVAVVDLPGAAGEALAQQIDGLFVGADLSRREDCRQVVERTRAQLGPIDVLVNNAGFQHIDAIEDFPEDVWDRLIAVMLTAPFFADPLCLARHAGERLGPGHQYRLGA